MRQIKLLLEYDGTAYMGWQRQLKREMTIQGILEDRIFRITGENAKIIGASRTDASVHAFGQVGTFRTSSKLRPEVIKRALNALLPQDIRVREASEVDHLFHPRHSARRKRYFYIIANLKETSVFLYKYAWLIPHPLDINAMGEAARALIGRHDFSSFRGTGSHVKNPVREVFSLGIERFDRIEFMTSSIKGEFLKIDIEADGFLRHMVRNIVGTIVEIGKGKMARRMEEVLESRDRKLAGPTAPPHGLFLEKIIY